MSGAGDNYEAVDMEESSDESGSDNEAFATKQEYQAYKEQFKVSKVKSLSSSKKDLCIIVSYRVRLVGLEDMPRLKTSTGVVAVRSMVEGDLCQV